MIGVAATFALFFTGSTILTYVWFYGTHQQADFVSGNSGPPTDAPTDALDNQSAIPEDTPAFRETSSLKSSDAAQKETVTATDLVQDAASTDERAETSSDPISSSDHPQQAKLQTPAQPGNVNPRRPVTLSSDYDDVPIIGGQRPALPAQEPVEEAVRLDVGFLVVGCSPSTDGKRMVAWGIDYEHDTPAFDPANANAPRPHETRLALVDMATRNVLATRTIAAVITQVDFNATGVYIVANEQAFGDTMSVLRLSADNLMTLARSSILAGQIESIADQLLISERYDNGGSRKYSLPDLHPMEPVAADHTTLTKSTTSRQIADGWLMDGVVWDEELSKPQLLLSLPGFRHGSDASTRVVDINAVPILQGVLLFAATGTAPSPRDWRLEQPRFSPHVPAVMRLTDRRGKISLDFLEQNSGQVLRSVPLRTGTPRHVKVATSSNWVIATLDKDTFLIPSQSVQSPVTVPFRIRPVQSTLVLSTGAPVAVRYEATDATKFELEIPGLKAGDGHYRQESRNGEFTIDLSSSVAAMAQRISESTRQNRRFRGDVAAWAEDYIRQSTATFSLITGRKPDGVPLQLEVLVRAYGEDLSVAVLRHVYLFEVPMSELQPYRKPTQPALVASQQSKAHGPAESGSDRPEEKADHARTTSPAMDHGRLWTDLDGRYLAATFQRLDGEVVVVVDQQQRTLRLPVNRLSEADRVWASQQATRTLDKSP